MPPVNDPFASATAIGLAAGELDVTTVAATVEGSEPGGLAHTVWAAWTCPTPSPGPVEFTLDLDGLDVHALNVYSGASLGALVLEAGGLTVDGSVDVVLPAPTAAAVYRIQVGATVVDATGAGVLQWDPYVDDEADEEAVLDDEMEDGGDVPDDAFVVDPEAVTDGVYLRQSETFVEPVLDEVTGRPVDWTRTSFVEEEWGACSIRVDGVPITKVRTARTLISRLAWQEPFGEGPGLLLVRGASLWDIGSAGFEWLREEANVDIDRVDSDGAFVEPLWSGIVQRIKPSSTGWELSIEGAFAGPAGQVPHRPKLTEKERDWGRALVFACRRAGRGAMRRRTITEVVFGITTRDRGSRSETLLQYVQRGLSLCQLANGDQWTMARVVDEDTGLTIRRKYGFRLKDRTTVDITVWLGQRGVDCTGLVRDLADVQRLQMAEGVNPDGGRWRNTKLPNILKETVPPYPGTPLDIGSTGDDVKVWQAEVLSDGHRTGDLEALIDGEFGALEADAAEEIQEAAGLPVTGVVDEDTWDATWSNGSLNVGGARFDPIASITEVEPWLYSSNGSVMGVNPEWDRTLLPLGTFVSYGQDVTKKQGRRSAKADIARAHSGGWRGQIVFTGDPAEMSRRSIKEGVNIRVMGLPGDPLLHGAGVTWSGPGTTVTVDVDQRARDRLTLAELRTRDKAARRDPAKQALAQLRRSKQDRDTPGPWDSEGGWGLLPIRDAVEGWNVYRVAAGKYGSLSRVVLVTEPDVEFAAALFGARVKKSWLRTYFPTPLADHGEATDFRYWDRPARQDGLRSRRFIEAWGEASNPCGYSPGYKTNPESGKATGHAVTGRFDTDTTTDYVLLEEPKMWLAVYVTGDTTVRGQIFLLPNE